MRGFANRLLAVLVLLLPATVSAAETVHLELNWFPQVDHAAFYYAKQQGWYQAAGIDIVIQAGKGSGAAAQKVGLGSVEFGIADLGTVLLAKSKGADAVAVMSIYANSPQGFYWVKSSGIRGPQDFPGHTIGNPPGDASRVMWPAFAAAVKIDPNSVKFVNVAPQAKLAALKSRAIDITSDFYPSFDAKVKAFGDDLGYVLWRDIGLNPYGNSLIVNGKYMQEHRATVAAFVKVTQSGYAACVADEAACIKSLLAEVSGLEETAQREQWQRIKELMRDPFTSTKGLGWIDGARVKADYVLVEKYFGIEKPFAPDTIFSTAFLDPAVKMPK